MDRLLTLKETGKLLNVSKQTLQRWDNMLFLEYKCIGLYKP